MRRADFVRFKKKASSKTQSGKQHTIFYTISAVDSNGQKLVVGEGFKGAGQADAAVDYIGSLFGLVPKHSPPEPDMGVEDYDLLTTD